MWRVGEGCGEWGRGVESGGGVWKVEEDIVGGSLQPVPACWAREQTQITDPQEVRTWMTHALPHIDSWGK